MNKEEMKLFMKQHYDNVDDFDNLPFVKSIREEAKREVVKEIFLKLHGTPRMMLLEKLEKMEVEYGKLFEDSNVRR